MSKTLLACPCDKKVSIEVENGIVVYKHEDGTGCKMLNRFYKDKCATYAFQRAWLAIEENDVSNFSIFMTTENDKVLFLMMDKLKLLGKDELKLFFKFVFTQQIKPIVKNSIRDAIVTYFGNSGERNIKIYEPQFRITNKLDARPRWRMESIDEVNSSRKETKDTILEDLAKSFMVSKKATTNSLNYIIKKLGG